MTPVTWRIAAWPKTALLSYRGNRYSVPFRFAGKTVLVRGAVSRGRFEIYSDIKVIAEHQMLTLARNIPSACLLRRGMPTIFLRLGEFSTGVDSHWDTCIMVDSSRVARTAPPWADLRRVASNQDLPFFVELCGSDERRIPAWRLN